MAWVNVSDRLPDTHSGRFNVELASGGKVEAYFYQDGERWARYYEDKPCHWWHRGSKEPLWDVVRWEEK